MKKILSLTTAVILAFGMTGCGDKAKSDSKEVKETTATTTAAPETTTTTTAQTTTVTTTSIENEWDELSDYEFDGLTNITQYSIPKSWNIVEKRAGYRKFSNGKFDFSVQIQEEKHIDSSKSIDEISKDIGDLFTKLVIVSCEPITIDDVVCYKLTCEEDNGVDNFIKIACPTDGGVAFYNFFNNSDFEYITQQMEKVIKNIKIKKPQTTTTKATTTTETTTAPETTTTPTTTIPIGKRNALSKALDYLKVMAFSYTGLIKQLEYEGFTHEEAVYGADNCGADWYEQAAKKAQSYIDVMSFSREGLIDQLIYEGFTPEEAEYGASAVGY